MICLGIESTAHTFGAAVVSRKGEILSDVRDSYSTEKGGIIPKDAAIHHENVYHDVIRKALVECGKKIDFIAQEMQRETNTIGSKLQDKIVIGAVVALKSKIEKIREQAQNIE